VRKDPARFARVCGELRDVAVARKQPATAIAALAAAVEAARPTPDHLTPQHAMLFQVGLAVRADP
jgi:COP9 signalosome complex subunit 3